MVLKLTAKILSHEAQKLSFGYWAHNEIWNVTRPRKNFRLCINDMFWFCRIVGLFISCGRINWFVRECLGFLSLPNVIRLSVITDLISSGFSQRNINGQLHAQHLTLNRNCGVIYMYIILCIYLSICLQDIVCMQLRYVLGHFIICTRKLRWAKASKQLFDAVIADSDCHPKYTH